ncbi:AAA family ATPase [Bacteroides sp. 224]|uniref:AAA family ATPase n=1 Tax=Bacteroides sp. 224 TaxID=2302936 RepID=UPI0013D3E0EC|nr:AAA family ATPase [Bacteroides sp. 224]NDV65051.1 ATP-binding protein [Bacteroides sp. 224]
MGKIKIKYFGPIREGYLEDDGFMDISKVTFFIGNQGSGKSTVAKLISTFSWIEKVIFRGDYEEEWFTREGILRENYCTYHRIENYFRPDTYIEYQGDAYTIKYENNGVSISKTDNNEYELPQVMYIPAERNFLAYVEDPRKYKDISESLVEFLGEYIKAYRKSEKAVSLPINGVTIEYEKSNDLVYIKGRDYRIKLSEASSGFQSVVPLYLASKYLSDSIKDFKKNVSMSSEEEERFAKLTADVLADSSLTDKQRRIVLSQLGKRFNKTAFINIVEEPEQNLFPTSQWEMLQSLLSFSNEEKGNKLIVTTHSPYLINYLTLAVKAAILNKKIESDKLREELGQIIALNSVVAPENLSVFELNEENGTIRKLETYKGLPSDEHQLNEKLEESNDLFAALLEIQQKL